MQNTPFIVSSFAQKNHGIVTVEDLKNLGLSESTRRTILGSRYFTKLHRSIYHLNTIDKTYKTRIYGDILSCGNYALATGNTTLSLVSLIKPTHSISEIIVSLDSAHNQKECRIKRRSDYHLIQKTSIEGIPSVSIEYALISVFDRYTTGEMTNLIIDAQTKKLTSTIRIRKQLNLLNKVCQKMIIYKTLEIIETQFMGIESMLEKRILDIIDKTEIPQPILQFKIRIGNSNFRLDMAYPSRKICIEIDGYAFHSKLHQFNKDRTRQNLLTLNGWHTIRITHQMSDVEIISTLTTVLTRSGLGS